ncbi:hypothetical protein M514_08957 [Trichuris suis]|uniref:Uncharacterized protein n=1 Tax=Trichuris suis TaxID=68888 RepID=A0A085LZ16_9BILA|nr:hypothetical protein M513_08957 [Trichuris suis]KFD70389.1 hypothetical protein M514_08957 [Trichuris suis]
MAKKGYKQRGKCKNFLLLLRLLLHLLNVANGIWCTASTEGVCGCIYSKAILETSDNFQLQFQHALQRARKLLRNRESKVLVEMATMKLQEARQRKVR